MAFIIFEIIVSLVCGGFSLAASVMAVSFASKIIFGICSMIWGITCGLWIGRLLNEIDK